MRAILILLQLACLVSCKDAVQHRDAADMQVVQSINNEEMKQVEKGGIVYFSFDNGESWENKSVGLPSDINLTDLAVSHDLLMLSTKQNGIFTFDSHRNRWSNTLARPATSRNVDAANIYNGKLLIGTEGDGIFVSSDRGTSWTTLNSGLQNLAIRRIAVIGKRVFVGTNGGLYVLNAQGNGWSFQFGQDLQVNGITECGDELFIGTNRGVFKSKKGKRAWEQVMDNIALHNISADGDNVYALAYNELFASPDNGTSWRNIQEGLPGGLYSFQLKQKGNHLYVGQWDGIYRKDSQKRWQLKSAGLPGKFPVTELVVFNDILIVSSSGWIEPGNGTSAK